MTGSSKDTDLKTALTELGDKLNGFKVFLKYGIPDSVLFQFGIDVLEQATATLIVAQSDVRRAAVANARAAFEAAMDMLLLVADPAAYDEMGAFVRACELLTWEDMYQKRDRADAALGMKPEGRGKSPDEIVALEAEKWEKDSPGVTRMYKRVLEQARHQQRWKHHWSGIGTLRDRAQFIATKLSGYAGFVEIAEVLWGLQSVHAHPAPRTGIRPSEVNEKGQLVFRSRPTEGDFALAMAAASCTHALDAIRAREKYIK
jgi:hypothetical protein